MCTGAELIPLVAAAVGTGAGAYAKHQQVKNQGADALRNIQAQQALNQKGDQAVQENVRRLNSSNPQDAEAEARAGYLQAVRQSRVLRGGKTNSGASERYNTDVGAANRTLDAQGDTLAGQLAKIDAPVTQRQTEAEDLASTNSDIGLLNRQSAATDFLNRLRAAGRRPNPFLSAGGDLATGFAGSYKAPAAPQNAIYGG